MSLAFPIPDWDNDTFSYPDVIVNGSYGEKASVKQTKKSVKRKHETEGTLKKVQAGNVETPLQAIKKKTNKIDKTHGEEDSKSMIAPKNGQKKKKKKEQKDIRAMDHNLGIPPNHERSLNNAPEPHTENENKSLPCKRKKKRKNNKYKDLNIKQKAEKMAKNHTEDKVSVGKKVKLEQQDSGDIKENVNVFIQASVLEEKVQSSPKKEPKKKKKKKTSLLEAKYNMPQDSSTVNKNSDSAQSHDNVSHDTDIVSSQENKVNQDHSSATTFDVKKKKKKKKKNSESLDSHNLPHSKESSLCLDTSECTQNGGTGEKLKVKKKNKIKGKKTVEFDIKKKKEMERSLCTETSEKVDDDDEQDGTLKKKKKKKEKIKENGVLLKVTDTVSPKKAKLENQKIGGKQLKTEDSEAEDMIFDGNEECSEEFNEDFNALLSSLNFNQFNSKKKSKKKGTNDGGNLKVKNKPDISKMENGKHSVDKEWEGKDNGNIKGVTGIKRKRDSPKTKGEEISGRQKKMKTKANNSDAGEETKTPIRKGAKFNREKLSKLLEQAANMERERPNPSLPSDPVDTLKKRMEDRLMAARFRLVNQELYTKSSTEAKQLFKKDPEAFDVYHQGFQAQVRQWPVNPQDLIVTWLSKKPKEWVVADMGCGEATLAQRVPQSLVHSLDLVAANARVTACDMAHTPLAAASVDVVVFCLSLMGTNLKDFVIEANRILREGGIMKIAEVESRCGDVKEFEKHLGKFGFHCTSRNTSCQYFFLLEFKKNLKLKKTAALPDLHLKPCLYKKR